MRRSSRERKSVEFYKPVDGRKESDDDTDASEESETHKIKQKPKITSDIKNAPKIANGNRIFVSVCSTKVGQDFISNWIIDYSAAGAQQNWISYSIDLDGLNAEELDELLSDMIESVMHSKNPLQYPLVSADKSHQFKHHYHTFWENLMSKVSASADSVRITHCIVEILIQMSTIAFSNLRHCVTEACVAIGTSLLTISRSLREKLKVMDRQSRAEENVSAARNAPSKRGGGGAGSRSTGSEGEGLSKKHQAIRDIQTQMTETLREYESIIDVIFNAIYLHRYKDTLDVIRCCCAQLPGIWYPLDSERFFTDQYLKYLGWQCSDRSTSCRKEAVKSLQKVVQVAVEDKSIVSSLQRFVDRFVDRFIEISVGDVDDVISLTTIQLMRTLQIGGLLDGVPQEDMDEVDRLVFDGSASANTRYEALLFMMSHTQGFEEIVNSARESDAIGNVDEDVKKRKKGKSGGHASHDLTSLSHKRRVANQLETLAEFAEYHLVMGDTKGKGETTSLQLEPVKLLAEAVWNIPDCDLMHSWEILISLLLREEEDHLLASPLSDNKVVVLLRLLSHTAKDLSTQFGPDAAAIDSSKKVSNKSTKSLRTHGSEKIWHLMNDQVVKYLPKLLLRYRGDDETLFLTPLLDIMEYIDISYTLHNNGKVLTSLLKTIMELVQSVRLDDTVQGLGNMLRKWMKGDKKCSKQVTSTLSNIANSLWEKFWSSSNLFSDFVSKSSAKSKTSHKRLSKDDGDVKGKRSSESGSGRGGCDESEFIFDMSMSLKKLSVMWKCHDLRSLCTQASVDMMDHIYSVSETTLQYLDSVQAHSTKATSKSDRNQLSGDIELLSHAILSFVHMEYYMMLWKTRDVYASAASIPLEAIQAYETSKEKALQEEEEESTVSTKKGSKAKETKKKRKSLPSEDAVANEDDEVGMVIHKINILIASRQKLIDLMVFWMMADDKEKQTAYSSSDLTSEDDVITACKRKVSCEIFRILGDIRTLFPVKGNNYLLVDRLAWTPSHDVLQYMRNIFEYESKVFRDLLSDLGGGDDASNMTASDKVKSKHLSLELIETILNPLGKGMIYDVQNVNRRQAAAVLGHIMHSTNEVQDLIRQWIKKIKEQSISKYLEIQMVAIKAVYSDRVLKSIELKEKIEVDDKSEDEEDYDGIIENGLEHVRSLGVRLAQTMGVGKCKDPALVNFIHAMAEHACSKYQNIGVLTAIEPYLRLVNVNDLKQLSQQFDEISQSVINDVNDNDDSSLSKIIHEFRGHLGKEGIASSRPVARRTSNATSSSFHKTSSRKNPRLMASVNSSSTSPERSLYESPIAPNSSSFSPGNRFTLYSNGSDYSESSKLGKNKPFTDKSPVSAYAREGGLKISTKHDTSRNISVTKMGLHLEDLSPDQSTDAELVESQERLLAQRQSAAQAMDALADDIFMDLDTRPTKRHR